MQVFSGKFLPGREIDFPQEKPYFPLVPNAQILSVDASLLSIPIHTCTVVDSKPGLTVGEHQVSVVFGRARTR